MRLRIALLLAFCTCTTTGFQLSPLHPPRALVRPHIPSSLYSSPVKKVIEEDKEVAAIAARAEKAIEEANKALEAAMAENDRILAKPSPKKEGKKLLEKLDASKKKTGKKKKADKSEGEAKETLVAAATATTTTTTVSTESTAVASPLDIVLDILNSFLDATALLTTLSLSIKVTPEDMVKVCDDLDAHRASLKGRPDGLKARAYRQGRTNMLATMMQEDYNAYVATAMFLSPSRIPREELPNVQDVPLDTSAPVALDDKLVDEKGNKLVADCALDEVEYKESWLDKTLMSIFRKLVTEYTEGVTSNQTGIDGLLEQGRTYMLQPNQTPEAQHAMVRNCLKDLMTPVLPPFYRLFMSGIVPQLNSPWDGKQFGPLPYAPFLTSLVTPTFFGFLGGPAKINRRQDGKLGGMVVEKCKFLQKSNCKGLCLHQCKLPAEQFFDAELGLPLTVSPNFETQECQWSFGEVPLAPEKDPYFPEGCIKGCPSRQFMDEDRRKDHGGAAPCM